MVAQGPGEAVANANSYHSYASGYCLQWVRIDWEIGSLYASAIDAWNGAKYRHPGDRNPPKGAPLFYRGGNYGHIVIAKEDGMRSTDCTYSGHVDNAAINWPEIHWGHEYLGWTEDLNGIRLPNLVNQPPPKDDDPMPQYDHAAGNDERTIKAGEWTLLQWTNVPAGKAFEEGNPGANMAGRVYSATVNVVVEIAAGGSVQVQPFEWEDGEVAETNKIVRFEVDDGWIRGTLSHQGSVADGRRLRWRIKPSVDAVLKSQDAVVLSWERG